LREVPALIFKFNLSHAMKKLICSLLLLFVLLAAAHSSQTVRVKPLAITHVNVIDATGSPARADMTVLVADGRIAAISKSGRVKVPTDAEVLNATGKFLIPGLQDMHLHLTITPDQAVSREVILPMLVAYGVTGVRDMGGDWQRLRQLREEISAGKIIGPRILSPGPFVDGPQPPNKVILPVSNEDEARQAVRKLKADGVDFIKVQALVGPAEWRAVLSEATQQHLTVAGHIPERISAFDVATSGQRSIEHISPVIPGDAGLLLACSDQEAALRAELLEFEKASQQPNADRQQQLKQERALQSRMISTYDQMKCERLMALLVEHQVWAVPTQILGRQLAPLDSNDVPRDEALRLIPLSTRTSWETRRNAVIKASSKEDFCFRKAIFEKSRSLVGVMHRTGVRLMAGTDAIDGCVLPGLSLHEELELMVESGLTPMEALQTATRNPALFLGRLDSSGTIERGKEADLLLLDANPLTNISNTLRINTIIFNGQLISPARRREMLDKVAVWANEH
jgi:imidazolonepropionase-like amidohydrolase